MMVRSQQRILVIGDVDRRVEAAVHEAAPRAEVVAAGTVFDAIAELSATEFETVLAPAEPIERRPEAAVRTLRQAAGDARLVMFGHPTLEPLSRKMLEFGVDDYVVTPVMGAELAEILKSPVYREVEEKAEGRPSAGLGTGRPKTETAPAPAAGAGAAVASSTHPQPSLPGSSLPIDVASVVLDALLHHPGDAPGAAVAQLNRILAPVRVSLHGNEAAPPPAADEMMALSHPVSGGRDDTRVLYLQAPAGRDQGQARKLLGELAQLFSKLLALHDRSTRLQKLAITDELTGLANARWFKHFLASVMETSRKRLAPVTLLLFDIDDFKKYNDRHGHAVGDEILKQTAQLMKRSVREHDLVARIGGDEFAVVFWEKEGPRQPRDPHDVHSHGTPGRPPQTPQIMCDRFQRLLSQHVFSALGPGGQGTLTISGGLATFPWNGQTPDDLIKAADHALMFGAKKSGKNSIALVGDEGCKPG